MKPYRGPPMTLGSAAAAHLRLTVWCKACGRRSEPDPAGQARWYGPETPVPEWRRRLVCSRCGDPLSEPAAAPGASALTFRIRRDRARCAQPADLRLLFVRRLSSELHIRTLCTAWER